MPGRTTTKNFCHYFTDACGVGWFFQFRLPYRVGAWRLGRLVRVDAVLNNMCRRYKESISCMRLAATALWSAILRGKLFHHRRTHAFRLSPHKAALNGFSFIWKWCNERAKSKTSKEYAEMFVDFAPISGSNYTQAIAKLLPTHNGHID